MVGATNKDMAQLEMACVIGICKRKLLQDTNTVNKRRCLCLHAFFFNLLFGIQDSGMEGRSSCSRKVVLVLRLSLRLASG